MATADAYGAKQAVDLRIVVRTGGMMMSDAEMKDDNVADLPPTPSLTPPMRIELMKRLGEFAGWEPTIALFGKTGAGKSSLGNALFGRKVFDVSSVKAGTRKPDPIATLIFGIKMHLIDFPGVGESKERDDEYRQLYDEWVKRIDVALWLIKVDDRVLAPDLDYFERVIKPSGFPLDRIVFVVSQVEKTDPMKEWDWGAHEPGPTQRLTIQQKMLHVQETFGLAGPQIVAVSGDDRYNLSELAEAIVMACPKEAALNVARALESALKTEKVKETVLEKIKNALIAFYKNNPDEVHEAVKKLVAFLFKRLKR